jgi:hypothetical protein
VATYITGRDLILAIDSDNYDAQASSVTLGVENNQFVGETLDDRFYKTIDKTATLSVEMYADWGDAASLCEALWDAAKTAPDTALTFSFTANGTVFTGSCLPNYPAAGGGAVDVLTTSVELVVVDGSVTRA